MRNERLGFGICQHRLRIDFAVLQYPPLIVERQKSVGQCSVIIVIVDCWLQNPEIGLVDIFFVQCLRQQQRIFCLFLSAGEFRGVYLLQYRQRRIGSFANQRFRLQQNSHIRLPTARYHA